MLLGKIHPRFGLGDLSEIGFWLFLLFMIHIVLPIFENIDWDDLGLGSWGNINPRLLNLMPWVTQTLG
jgi:hypothetical protein